MQSFLIKLPDYASIQFAFLKVKLSSNSYFIYIQHMILSPSGYYVCSQASIQPLRCDDTIYIAHFFCSNKDILPQIKCPIGCGCEQFGHFL